MVEPNLSDNFIKSNEIPITVGRANITWNTLQYMLFQAFWQLSGLDVESAKAVYFAVKSDRSQRDMLTEMLTKKLEPKNPVLNKKFMTCIGEVNKLAGKRNDTIHVVYIDTLDSEKTRLAHDIGFLKGKVGRDLVSEIHNLTMQMLDLAEKIGRLDDELFEFRKPTYQGMLSAALLDIPPHIAAGSPSRLGFGLLGNPAKKAPLAESTEE